jgi:hypothetical protein
MRPPLIKKCESTTRPSRKRLGQSHTDRNGASVGGGQQGWPGSYSRDLRDRVVDAVVLRDEPAGGGARFGVERAFRDQVGAARVPTLVYTRENPARSGGGASSSTTATMSSRTTCCRPESPPTWDEPLVARRRLAENAPGKTAKARHRANN